MAKYTIDIDDTLAAGLQEALDAQNAGLRMANQPPLADVTALLTFASTQMATQALQKIHERKAQVITRALSEGKTAAEAIALAQ